MPKHAFSYNRKNLEEKYGKLKNHPSRPAINLILLSILPILEIIYAISNPEIIEGILRTRELGFLLLSAPFFALFGYVYKVHSLQRDLIKMLIANAHSWLYNPAENPGHWVELALKYPEIFQKGNCKQNTQDEFWGKYQFKGQNMDFYSAVFSYTKKTETGQKKSETTYHNEIFSIKLNKKLQTDFQLVPEGLGQKFLNLFRSKEINTESAQFSDNFSVYYSGERVTKELDIVKTLNPAVQIQLLELRSDSGSFSVLFKDNVVIFEFKKSIFGKFHTNFFRKAEIDPRDIEKMNQTFNKLLEISSAIIPFLD